MTNVFIYILIELIVIERRGSIGQNDKSNIITKGIVGIVVIDTQKVAKT